MIISQLLHTETEFKSLKFEHYYRFKMVETRMQQLNYFFSLQQD